MRYSHFFVCALGLTAPHLVAAQTPATPPVSTLPTLPVREVTVFKDGYAFVLQEGGLPVNAAGEVVLDNLPMPVVGTFWPYQANGKLRGVVASRQPVTRQQPPLSMYDLLLANIGADVTIIEPPERDLPDRRFDAKILDVPRPTATEPPPLETDAERTQRLAPSQLILLQTKDGVLARTPDSISQVIFKHPPRRTSGTPEFRNLLRLQLDGPQRPAGDLAQVGMVYLQKGLRWIPSYRLSLNGQGHAAVKMQATLVNELVDLDNTAVNLVIGVPSFAFKDTLDPLSLQNTLARLSPLFDTTSRTSNAFSNAIQSQVASSSYGRINDAEGTAGNAPGVDGGSNEDFFVFTTPHLSLKKGERMAFPLAQYNLKYQDIYVQAAPATPPSEMYRDLSYEQQVTVSKSLLAPSVMHKIRLLNTGTQPLTTAPTLIESDGRLLAQTLMTYTASGGRSDLDLAPAVDVTFKRRETEGKRTLNALKWHNEDYSRVDVGGRLIVTSYHNTPITVELTQQFIGTVDKAEMGGVIRKLGLGDDTAGSAGENLPSWWNYNSGDWRSINGLSSVHWTVTVPAKGSVELPYAYHYFWR